MADLNTPKGRTIHPILGQPEALDGDVKKLELARDDINKLGTTMLRVKNGDSCVSKRVDELKDKAGECSTNLDKVKAVYNAVSVALRYYQRDLQAAVDDSKRQHQYASDLLPKVNQAERDAAAAASAVTKFDQRDPDPHEDAAKAAKDHDDLSTASTDANNHLKILKEQLDGYKKNFDVTQDAFEASSRRTKSDLARAVDQNDAKDDWKADLLGFIESCKNILTSVVMVLAVVALFIPGLNGLVLALGAALLLCDIILAFNGKASGWDVALDVVGILPFGKMAVSGARGARAAAGSEKVLAKTRGGFKGALEPVVKPMRPSEIGKDYKALYSQLRGKPGEKAAKALEARSRGLKGPYKGNYAVNAERVVSEAKNSWKGMKSPFQSLDRMLKSPQGTWQNAKEITMLDNLPMRNQVQRDLLSGLKSEAGSFSRVNYVTNTIDLGFKGETIYNGVEGAPAISDQYNDVKKHYSQVQSH